MEEIFIQVKDYPNYSISNQGRIYSKYKNDFMTNQLSNFGYYRIQLRNKGKYKRWFIHELVLSHFDKEKPKNMECDHINRNRLDNRIENLRWVNRSDNMKNRKKYYHKMKIGTISKTKNNKYQYQYYINGIRNYYTYSTIEEAKEHQKLYIELIKIGLIQ